MAGILQVRRGGHARRYRDWLGKSCWPTAAVGLALALLTGCATLRRLPAADTPPAAPREFRGVWVATVANIDWPSKPGLPVAQQRAEMRAILDRARALRLNAVILQVRPAGDALYRSPLEPWSEYLTGAQGRPPAQDYDPLAEWVAEAHRRGLELHAWFNPYRARHFSARSPLAPDHIARIHPDAVKTYGDMLWMDPGEPAAVQQTLAVVRDVVRRYDIDGVHIDDYFYPYPIKSSAATAAPAAHPASALKPGAAAPGGPVVPEVPDLDFPDEPSWRRYLAGGGRLSRADWRRQNVSGLIERLYRTVHEEKPWVRMGISPYGLGRPDRRPAGIEGFSQYDKLYADVELWLERGWLDYLAPQLYWRPATPKQPFVPLLAYWAAENRLHRHLWPGLYTSMVNEPSQGWDPGEILAEIALVRNQPGAGGEIHFSMVAFLQDRRGIDGRLAAGPYAADALVPASPWLGGDRPSAPRLRRDGAASVAVSGPTDSVYAVWRRYGTQWRFSVQPGSDPDINVAADPALGPVNLVVVNAVSRTGAESPAAYLRIDTGGKSAH